MADLNQLATQLMQKGKDAQSGFPFDVNPIPGEIEVLQIVAEDTQELPIFLSVSEEQILCIVYLFAQDEVKESARRDMNEAMLRANVSMPLSAFALIDDRYVVYGALSAGSGIEDIVHELKVLSSNALEAIDAMRGFLN